jgi:outer membrane receptor protein involved in Fe transport
VDKENFYLLLTICILGRCLNVNYCYMIKKLKGFLLVCIACLFSFNLFAQSTTLKGSVASGASKEKIPAVSVSVKGSGLGTYTDDKGNFTLTVPKLPVTLVFSSVGFENTEVEISSASQSLDVELKVAATLGQEVVVSATRVATRILESPVTIERVNAAAIRNAPAASYYDVVTNLKGVDMMTSSLTFKTPTTRGFNGSGNTRFNQLVDGMDNQAPGLNFSVGSVVGLSELDVDNMELLPGASSALYGPGGMNGTLLINSKNPFKYQGLSFQVKTGLMHADGKYRNTSPYYNWGVRWAQKIGERFAFKITSELVQAQDWLAADQRNFLRTGTIGQVVNGTRATDPNYDGVNVYGDLNLVLGGIAQQAPFLAPYINSLIKPNNSVSRTGYTEKELVDPNTLNYKLGGAIHYKLTNNIEAILMGYWGTGNTVYTGSDRYSLLNLKIAQYKFELNSKNWFIRGWTTQENSGDSYNLTVTTRLTNERIKPSSQWYPEYGQAYLNARLGGLNEFDAHTAARAFADAGRPAANSQQFRSLFDQVRKIPISQNGGLFLDRTDLYSVEGQYNLSSVTKDFADILIGGNFRRFVLNSQGTLFADYNGPIGINEFGGYIQATRKIAERLTLTGSVRYDKNQNFEGRFTPRATAVIQLNKNNNIRLSFQTAYRFPSTQQQWINLNVGGNVQLIGGVPFFDNFFNFNSNPIYTLESVNSNTPSPKVASIPDFKPESVTSYELGYKGLVANNKLLIDVYGYYGRYQNFLVRELAVQSKTNNPATLNASTIRNSAIAQIFSLPTNTTSVVETYGWGLGLEYKLPANFYINTNLSSDILQDVPAGFIAFFNSPKYRANVTVGNNGFGKKKLMGFSVAYRWQDKFFYESDFATGNVPAIHVVDAQINCRIPKIKSMVKLGANNLLNQYYLQGFGNPSIGGLYYVGFSYNVF